MVGTCFHSDLSRPALCARLTVLMACARAIAMQAATDGHPEGTAAQAIEREIVLIEDELHTRDTAADADAAERADYNRIARKALGMDRDPAEAAA